MECKPQRINASTVAVNVSIAVISVAHIRAKNYAEYEHECFQMQVVTVKSD